jgi:hypothetical protein
VQHLFTFARQRNICSSRVEPLRTQTAPPSFPQIRLHQLHHPFATLWHA